MMVDYSQVPQLASIEAEENVLGSILIDDSKYAEAAMYIDCPEAFFLIRHEAVWVAMTDLKASNEPIDLVTLADALEKKGKLDEIGGRGWLIGLSNGVGTHVYASVYAEMVARMYTRRKLAMASDQIKRLAYNTELDIHAVQTESEDILLKAGSLHSKRFGTWGHEAISELYDDFERMLLDNRTVPGVPTGINSLDDLFLGFEPSQLSIWAGRPGMGKSSTFLSIAYNRCLAGDFVLVFSGEMGYKQVVMRLWSMVSGVPVKKIKLPRLLSPEERKKVTDAVVTVSEFNLFIDDTPAPTPRHVKSITKIYKERYGVNFILFDGIYTASPNKDLGSQVLNVGSISSDLRNIARTYEIHVAATHQLNRAVESRANKKPMLADLRDSGQLEQDADKVVFLYRDEIYNEATEFPNQIDFIVAKHRDGSTGIASAYFEKTLMQVMNGSVHRVDLSDLE